MAIAVQTEAVLLVETRDCQWPVCGVHMPRKSVKIAAMGVNTCTVCNPCMPSESRSCRWNFWHCSLCPLYKVCLSYFIFIEFPTFHFKMAPLKPVRALVLLVAVLLVSELLMSPALAEVNISARIDYICFISSFAPRSPFLTVCDSIKAKWEYFTWCYIPLCFPVVWYVVSNEIKQCTW